MLWPALERLPAGVAQIVDSAICPEKPAVDIVQQYLGRVWPTRLQIAWPLRTVGKGGDAQQCFLAVGCHDRRARTAAGDWIALPAPMLIDQSGPTPRITPRRQRRRTKQNLDLAGTRQFVGGFAAVNAPILAVVLSDDELAALRGLLEQAPAPVVRTEQIDHSPPSSLVVTREMLVAAMDGGQLHMAFQPKVTCSDGRLAGFEGLVRWQHPEHGTIVPDQFISLVEQTGLSDRLTEIVFETAFGWFSPRRGSDLSLALNLSAASLGNIEIADRLAGLCDEHAVDPGSVIIEVTESSERSDCGPRSADSSQAKRVPAFDRRFWRGIRLPGAARSDAVLRAEDRSILRDDSIAFDGIPQYYLRHYRPWDVGERIAPTKGAKVNQAQAFRLYL